MIGNKSCIMQRFAFVVYLAILLLLLFSVACAKRVGQANLRSEMQDVYQAVVRLYSYVWSPEEFSKEENRDSIIGLLERLDEDFHRAERVTPVEMFEPGFRISLEIQQEMLLDIRKRFAAGAKDYAAWQLRALTTNCTACHSRYEVSLDFFGKVPLSKGDTFSEKLAYGEFLLASRQFDSASENLLALAKEVSLTTAIEEDMLTALKLWILVQVRVKNRPDEAAKELKSFLVSTRVEERSKEVINSWVKTLMDLSKHEHFGREHPKIDELARAAELLRSVQIDDPSLIRDELNLVSTLKASSILHKYLQGDIPPKARRRSTYLLALAYSHIPIFSFDAMGRLYLEQTIREFPESPEARLAYGLYEDYVINMNTGSGGLHLDEEEKKKLELLRRKAFGAAELVMPDTLPDATD